MVALMASMVICLGASAIDNVIKKTEMKGEVTSVEALKEATFMLQNEEAKVMYTPSGWDIKVATLIDAVSKKDNGGFYKLESVTIDDVDHFLIPVYNIDKSRRTFWDGNQYVNAQPSGNTIFGLGGVNAQHGQDGPNLAVWDITYEEGKGFAFHNVGRDIYLGSDDAAARPSEEIKYWKAYTEYIAGYDQTEVETAYALAIEAIKTSDAKAALETANTAFTTDANLDAYGDAVNAAINVINACEAVNAAYKNLDATGAAVAAEVLAKYNAGDYKDIAELRAAYILAAKAQTAAGAIMTGALVNPSFELGTLDGWTSIDGGAIPNNYNFGARTGDKFVERWTNSSNGGKLSDGSLMQTVTGLPNGYYTLTAEMQNLEQGNNSANGKGYYLVANGDSTEVAIAGETVKVTTNVTDGTLAIGAVMKGCTGNWVCVDNFQLTLVEPAPVFYSISVAEIVNGTVTADPEEAIEGAEVVLAVTPAEGYELESLSVVAGETAIEVSESYVFVMPAADVTVSATFAAIEEEPAVDANLIEIAQDQGKDLDTFPRAELVEGEEYNTYTVNADLTVAFKMMNVDVKDCDYVVIKFAEPVAAGWKVAFWGGQETADVPEGATEYKYVFADDANCAVQDDILPQICLMNLWGASFPLVAKVEGVYKHSTVATEPEPEPTPEPVPVVALIHTIDFTTQTSYPYYNMGAPEGSSFDVIDGALVIENTAERTYPWDLQPFICDWFSLKAGYDYVVRITMKASADGSAQLNMGTWSAAMYQQLAFTASEEYKTYDVAFPKSTVASSANDIHILFQGGKYVGKVEIAKVEVFEYEPTEKTYTIDVERYPGTGYDPTTATADLAEALSFLGVEAATAEMLSIVNPDGTEVSDYATYDGWFAADGTAKTWFDLNPADDARAAGVCVKFFQALEGGQFEICDMNGADVVGTTYTVKYALKANDKTAIFAINVKFVEKPAIYLADYTAKAETVELKIAAQDAEGNWAAESATEAINVADITALVGENYVVYGVGAKDGDKETLTNSYSCTPHPGFWCLADGTADVWDNSTFGVSFYAAEGVFKTWTKAAVTEDLSTTFYFVNEEAKEYVAYKVVLCAPEVAVPDAIEGVEAATAANGKYMENGKLVIIKNGKKFNAAGQAIK